MHTKAKVFQAKDMAILRKIHAVFLLPNFGQDVYEMSIYTQARWNETILPTFTLLLRS